MKLPRAWRTGLREVPGSPGGERQHAGAVSESRPLLEVNMLTAGYGGPTIIADVCLTARTGHLTAIVGPNGAGKSTLIKAIAGIVKPTSGTVRLNGEDVTGSPPQNLARRGMSYLSL